MVDVAFAGQELLPFLPPSLLPSSAPPPSAAAPPSSSSPVAPSSAVTSSSSSPAPRYLCLVSGLKVGEEAAADPLRLQLFLDYITGFLGQEQVGEAMRLCAVSLHSLSVFSPSFSALLQDHRLLSSVVRVVLCGQSLLSVEEWEKVERGGKKV